MHYYLKNIGPKCSLKKDFYFIETHITIVTIPISCLHTMTMSMTMTMTISLPSLHPQLLLPHHHNHDHDYDHDHDHLPAIIAS